MKHIRTTLPLAGDGRLRYLPDSIDADPGAVRFALKRGERSDQWWRRQRRVRPTCIGHIEVYDASVHVAARTSLIKNLARDCGFDACGVAEAGAIGRSDYLRAWLAAGRAGTMDYLSRHVDLRTDPRRLVPGARSVIVVALNYRQPVQPPPGHEPRGRIAMYAWGRDYHDVVRERLRSLVSGMRGAIDQPFEARACVDTAPVVEREWAAQAGIGWIGKNTLVLNNTLGSYFFLGVVITTLELQADSPAEDHCGTCSACLRACPTSAFPDAYQMDASKCISYLTIEHRGTIGPGLHKAIGGWVFGCDVCQAVCPFNRDAPESGVSDFAAAEPAPFPRLADLLTWSDDEIKTTFRGSAANRATPAMWRRNASIALANTESKRDDEQR